MPTAELPAIAAVEGFPEATLVLDQLSDRAATSAAGNGYVRTSLDCPSSRNSCAPRLRCLPSFTASEIRPSRSLRALIVDDDPNVAAGTAAMTECLGHVPFTATSAADALTILRTQPRIDLVIVDYALGDTTGTALAQDIQMSFRDCQ
jgi:hypothetical protein